MTFFSLSSRFSFAMTASKRTKATCSAVAWWKSAPVFDTFFHALTYMNVVIDENVKANRSVKLGKVVPFKGMVSCFVPPADGR